MSDWNDSECETYFADNRPMVTEKCKVFIGSNQIVVDAPDVAEPWKYAGTEQSPGHYVLDPKTQPRNYAGEGTLHHFDEKEILEGWWRETENGISEEGMWRIILGRADD